MLNDSVKPCYLISSSQKKKKQSMTTSSQTELVPWKPVNKLTSRNSWQVIRYTDLVSDLLTKKFLQDDMPTSLAWWLYP